MASIINLPKLPIFLWLRATSGIDMINNPGFVNGGMDREAFVSSALTFLQEKFLSGFIVENSDDNFREDGIQLPFSDYGILDLYEFPTVESYLKQYKNLRKKINKFGNKGGYVKVVEGELPLPIRSQIESIYANINPLIQTPFQDNYANMVMRISEKNLKEIIHFLTFIDNQLVGYHSFVLMNGSLFCLSGTFEKNTHSNFHAYDNMILETVRYGKNHKIPLIYFGPVLNPTKARMMNRFRVYHQKFYSRLPILNKCFNFLSKYSRINPRNFESYVNIQKA
jgi:hypothetical protein